jgi:hypothetical protein
VSLVDISVSSKVRKEVSLTCDPVRLAPSQAAYSESSSADELDQEEVE